MTSVTQEACQRGEPARGGRFHLRYDSAIGHAPAPMSYDQISAVREFLLR